MTISNSASIVIVVFWFVYAFYWAISARKVKHDIKQQGGLWKRLGAIIILGVILEIAIPGLLKPPFPQNVFVAGVAIILAVAGIGLAIWARWHLGANWSSQPAIKEGHDLITSGPYSFIRHPIYTGLLLAFVGTALVNGTVWSVVLIIFAVSLVLRVRTEERLMTQQFPAQYAEYKKKTKALIPFVW